MDEKKEKENNGRL